MRIDIVTGFPRMLEAPLQESIVSIGRKKEIVDIHLHDLRDYTDDKHRTIDGYPYGGGPGMVLKVEPFVRALDSIFSQTFKEDAHIMLTSPRGEKLDQTLVTKLSLKPHIIILCGHYKGVDERLHDFFKIHEISIGDYILSAGESAAIVLVDAMVRLLPGVIKDIESAWSDSFSDYLLDAPYYTRPEEYNGRKTPEVLLSGNHKKIDEWRQKQRETITALRRPDLYDKYLKSIK